jgi:hypothetical protein
MKQTPKENPVCFCGIDKGDCDKHCSVCGQESCNCKTMTTPTPSEQARELIAWIIDSGNSTDETRYLDEVTQLIEAKEALEWLEKYDINIMRGTYSRWVITRTIYGDNFINQGQWIGETLLTAINAAKREGK